MTTRTQPDAEPTLETAQDEIEQPEETLIAPRRGWQALELRELWKFRDLVYYLAWRDVKVKFKQTVLGAVWVVLQPLLMMVILLLVFGRAAGFSTGSVPGPIFYLSGLIPWLFFASSVTNSSESVVASEGIVSKVYFPRLAIPLSAVAAALVDFSIGFVLLALFVLYYGIGLGASILLLPLAAAGIMCAALGAGTLIAALNVAYRDFRYVARFLVQVWIFATPTIYMSLEPPPVQTAAEIEATVAGRSAGDQQGSANVGRPTRSESAAEEPLPPSRTWSLFDWNPLTGLIEFFRAALLGLPVYWPAVMYSWSVSLGMLAVGLMYFRRVEDTFADII